LRKERAVIEKKEYMLKKHTKKYVLQSKRIEKMCSQSKSIEKKSEACPPPK
jgi:hypothetical protein